MGKRRDINRTAPMSMVSVPRHEYARLVAAKARLDMIYCLIERSSKYMDSHEAIRAMLAGDAPLNGAEREDA